MTEVSTFQVTKKVSFAREHRSRRAKPPRVPEPPAPTETGRVPRIARLMALAIRFDGLIRDGAVENQAEVARLSHVTRARVTQILNLLHLAPDIQEAILMLPHTFRGRDRVREIHVRPIAADVDWDTQRQRWRQLMASLEIPSRAGHSSGGGG